MKLFVMLAMFTYFAFAQARADITCFAPNGQEYNARGPTRTFNKISKLIAQSGLNGSAGLQGVTMCDPTRFRTLFEGGIASPRVAYQNICGAIFEFNNDSDLNAFVLLMKQGGFSATDIGRVCADVAIPSRVGPYPGVTAGSRMQ